MARRYVNSRGFMFVGRGVTYPVALEGALKLKEVSYVHAEGYAAGELKHGPISLLDAEVPLVAVATRSAVQEKLISNVMEGRARDARVLAVATEGDEQMRRYADDILWVPDTIEALTPVLAVLDRVFGVRCGLVGTTHAYTAGQGLVDGLAGKDLRRGRAAPVNIVPTSTGAAKAISEVLPNLKGKCDGTAVRVPVVDGSLYDVVAVLEGEPKLAAVLDTLREAAKSDALRGVLDCVNFGGECAIGEGLAYEAAQFGLMFATEDMREGTGAFLARRKPEFHGR